jgi:hypothetical protein
MIILLYRGTGLINSLIRWQTRSHYAQDDDTWFCSELVYAAFQKAGIKLLNVDEAWKVSPALLAMSPYLRKL